MNRVNLHIGQVIQVFLTIGGDIEGQVTGLTNDELLMKNCIAKRSRRYNNVSKATIPLRLIKAISFIRCNRDEI